MSEKYKKEMDSLILGGILKEKINAYQLQPASLTPYPGTPLYK